MTSSKSKVGKKRKIWIYPSVRYRELEELYDLTLLCNKCLYCRFVFAPEARDHRFVNQCPRGDIFKHASYYAEGTVEIARCIIEGKLMWSETIAHILYTCTDCAHCEFWCMNAMRVYPLTIMDVMKEHYVNEVGLPSYWRSVVENIDRYRNPFDEPVEKRFSWLPESLGIPRRANVMLFVGDAYAYRYPEIALAAVKILKKLGVEIGLLYDGEYHSGYLMFRAGLRDKGEELLAHNIKALEESNAKTVVFLDPHDYRTFKKEASEEGLSYSFEVLHYLEFVAPLVEENKHKLRKLEMKVSYHDPCNLTRHIMPFPVWDQPREILKIIGAEIMEMPRNRLNTYCCGSGGGVVFTFPQLALNIARKRLEEATSIGVTKLVTSCPYCVGVFRRVASEFKLEIGDIIEILDMALE